MKSSQMPKDAKSTIRMNSDVKAALPAGVTAQKIIDDYVDQHVKLVINAAPKTPHGKRKKKGDV